jgi:hypothetical protein
MPLAAEKVEGYLVDKMCSAKVLKGGEDAAKAHTKDCALMPNCKSSGFGVVTADGKFIKFDKQGDGMAVDMLGWESTNKENIQATVNGKVEGDTIAVIALQLH